MSGSSRAVKLASPSIRRASRIRHLIDAMLTVLYLGFFSLSLLFAGYNVRSTIVLLVATTLLVILGWRNPPINAGERLCILYRTGFIPLYTSSFIFLAWLYKVLPNLIIDAATLIVVLASFIVTYAVARITKQAGLSVFITSTISGVLLAISGSYELLPAAFSIPVFGTLLARPRLLCDDRPLFYIASTYSSATFTIIVSILSSLPH